MAVFWFTRLHGATTQKTAIFVLTAVRTSNLFVIIKPKIILIMRMCTGTRILFETRPLYKFILVHGYAIFTSLPLLHSKIQIFSLSLCSQTSSIDSSLTTRDQISYPYKTTGKIIHSGSKVSVHLRSVGSGKWFKSLYAHTHALGGTRDLYEVLRVFIDTLTEICTAILSEYYYTATKGSFIEQVN
jgi:hypothetical protein